MRIKLLFLRKKIRTLGSVITNVQDICSPYVYFMGRSSKLKKNKLNVCFPKFRTNISSFFTQRLIEKMDLAMIHPPEQICKLHRSAESWILIFIVG